jgi:hypothetical protein
MPELDNVFVFCNIFAAERKKITFNLEVEETTLASWTINIEGGNNTASI